MTPFTILSQAIESRLAAQPAFAGVALIQEDAGDVDAMIERELGRVGMGVLLGVPEFTNQDPLSPLVNALIKVSLLCMEAPALWRKTGNEPHCADLSWIAARALQQFAVAGFQPTRVMSGQPVTDKDVALQLYRIEIETMQIFGAG